MRFQHLQQCVQVRWEVAGECQGGPRTGVKYAQKAGVERLPTKCIKDAPGLGSQPPDAPPTPIERVSNDRMTNVGHMNADLMGAACFETALDQAGNRFGGGAIGLFHLVEGYGPPAIRDNGLLLAI